MLTPVQSRCELFYAEMAYRSLLFSESYPIYFTSIFLICRSFPCASFSQLLSCMINPSYVLHDSQMCCKTSSEFYQRSFHCTLCTNSRFSSSTHFCDHNSCDNRALTARSHHFIVCSLVNRKRPSFTHLREPRSTFSKFRCTGSPLLFPLG